MLCPANMLGYMCAIRRAFIGRHPERSCARLCFSRVFRGRATQSKDLSPMSMPFAVAAVEEPLFDVNAIRGGCTLCLII